MWKKKAILGETKNHNTFVEELSKVNPNIEPMESYIGAHKKIRFKCKLDGCEWYGYPSNLLNNSAGCPYCNISNGERLMIDVLNEIWIDIIPQYSIPECKLVHVLKFDAFDVKNNIAFEYNGEQHYRPVDFAGKGEIWAFNQFNLTKSRDNTKKSFCENNGIEMIIVPYWERNNMKEFITTELKHRGVINY